MPLTLTHGGAPLPDATAPDPRLTELLDGLIDAFIALDGSFRITMVNESAEQLLRMERASLIGRVLWDVFPAAGGSRFGEELRRVAHEGRAAAFEAFATEISGWLEVQARPFDGGISISFRDVTLRKRLERRTHLLQLATLGVDAAPDLTGALTSLLHELRRATGWEWAEAWLPGTTTGELRLVDTLHRRPDERLARFDEETRALEQAIARALPPGTMRAQHVTTLCDLAAAPWAIRGAAAKEAGLEEGLFVPILWYDKPLAALVFMSRSKIASRDWVPVLTDLCDDLARLLERKRTEAEVDRVFALSLDLLCVVDTHGRFRRVNPAFTRTLGWSADDLVGRQLLDFVHPDDQEATQREIEQQARGNPTTSLENRFLARSGSPRWLSWTAMPVPEEGLVYAVARDITDAKRAQQALVTALERHEQVSRATNDVIWDLLCATSEVTFSDAIVRGLRFAPGEVGRTRAFWASRLHPDDRPIVTAALDRALADPLRTQWEAEYRFRRGDGTWADIVDRGTITRDAAGRARRLVASMLDISDRRRSERFVAAQRSILEAIASGATLGVLVAQVAGLVESQRSPGICLVATRQGVWPEGPGPDESSAWTVPVVSGAGAQLGSIGLSGVARQPDEADLQLLATAAHMLGIALERHSSIAELRLLHSAVERLNDIVVITEPGPMLGVGPRIAFVNEAFEQKMGWPRHEVTGVPIALLTSGWSDDAAARRVLCAMENRAAAHEVLTAATRDGRRILLELDVVPIIGEGGRSTHQVAIARDVTERRALEEQLLQSQKMEAIGRLAGGIAHDFNNMLTAISGFAELLQQDLPEESLLRDDVGQIQAASTRAATLTRQLLAFSRKQLMQPRLLDPNALVSDLDRMLRRLIGEDVQLVADLREGVGLVRVDAGQLEQVIVNLVVNARDALPGGGTIRIATSRAEHSADATARPIGSAPGPHVEIAVIDEGHGMDDQTLARAFEPFFTTKDRGKGTGLGLSTVYGIATQSGGYVRATSEEGLGSTFIVGLPVVEALAAEPSSAPEAETYSRGTETVLVVEDERLVRDYVCVCLRRLGYTVLSAADGTEAIRIAEDETHIDLLASDVVMPGMSGREVAERLSEMRPGLRVLFLSGHAEDAIVQKGVMEGEVHLLAKPFTQEALARKVREVLDRDSDG